ncbi:HAMP domain-containing sensor histidine kinase [Crassaminicella profunda]|uniref:HAMP domain-containing sensor histidine kinase n=1 Tax=Crassaminicella profunda TaxID=1286698 RepID=UPI001CA71921|nr:HAMP domain-containing sensor histidine kinase [Crassaminicella profunda]QZY55996.1 HAMP domain-containing histidine kinase [Crassaminicella profunda]
MKTKSVKFRLVASFMVTILIFAFIMAFFLIQAFKKYYYEDVYKTLEASANNWISGMTRSKSDESMTLDAFMKIGKKDIRKIEEIYWFETKNGNLIRKSNDKIKSHFTESILENIEESIKNQTEPVKRYEMKVKDRTLFFVIAKYENNSENIKILSNLNNVDLIKNVNNKNQISNIKNTIKDSKNEKDIANIKKDTKTPFVLNVNKVYPVWFYRGFLKWKTEDETFIEKLHFEVAIVFILVIITMFFISIYLSRFLTKPLLELKNSVKNISNRKLDRPIEITRDDEIGFLANAIEEMRKELLKYDEDQRFKLHAISHELKTPIMSVKSYLEALKNGLYPKGTLESSLEVIDEECSRLETLVYNLLYIQRLDYLDTEIKSRKKINLKDTIEGSMRTFSIQLKTLEVEMDIDEVWMDGDDEQLKMILQNLLSNQVRYAKTRIKIGLTQDHEKIYLNFYNDGEKIENPEMIFELFKKGKNGKTGMGLYIVKRLLKMNKGKIVAINEEHGVSFQIEISKD